MKNKIFLLPIEQYTYNHSNLNIFQKSSIDFIKMLEGRENLFFITGKQCIHYLMEKYKLNKEDEVWITTTTNSTFVSSCVTCTIFNYCKVSRVLTDKTKMIWVIHEFGFPHTGIMDIVRIGKKLKIPVVEDSAHSLDSFFHYKRLGFFGDYGMYSLPKIFPMKTGGLLVGKGLLKTNTHYDKIVAGKIQKEFFRFFPYLNSFTEKRRLNYRCFKNKFQDYKTILTLHNHVNPFVFGFVHDMYKTIYYKLDLPNSSIELGKTYVKNFVFLPVNQFATSRQVDHAANQVLKVIANNQTLS